LLRRPSARRSAGPCALRRWPTRFRASPGWPGGVGPCGRKSCGRLMSIGGGAFPPGPEELSTRPGRVPARKKKKKKGARRKRRTAAPCRAGIRLSRHDEGNSAPGHDLVRINTAVRRRGRQCRHLMQALIACTGEAGVHRLSAYTANTVQCAERHTQCPLTTLANQFGTIFGRADFEGPAVLFPKPEWLGYSVRRTIFSLIQRQIPCRFEPATQASLLISANPPRYTFGYHQGSGRLNPIAGCHPKHGRKSPPGVRSYALLPLLQRRRETPPEHVLSDRARRLQSSDRTQMFGRFRVLFRIYENG